MIGDATTPAATTPEGDAAPAAPAEGGERREPARLWNRNYSLLWSGQFVSGLGNHLFDVALALWIVQLTNSASLMGLLLAVSSIPQLIMAPIGGVLADRYSRKKILVLSDLISGLLVLSLAAVAFLLPGQLWLSLGWLFCVSVGLSVIGAFFAPAAQATVPDLVPRARIASAMSLGQLSGQIGLLVGAGIGGTAFRLLGAPLLFFVNAISFFVAAGNSALIAVPARPRPATSGGWRAQMGAFRADLREGLQFVWRSEGLRTLVLITAVGNFFSTPFISLLQFYLRDYLQVPRFEDWVGYLGAAVSVGSLLGFAAVGLLRVQGRQRAIAILAVMILDGLLYTLLVVAPGPIAALALVGLSGATGAFLIVSITTLVQLITPQAMRGRVFGLLGTISGSIVPIAYGVSGIVADATGKNIGLIYTVCGAVLLGLSFLIALSPSVRGFLAYEPPEAAAQP
jgi:MFS transporter, DHA3 family, macrolide efflux protein